jgi:hypothetical protein
VAVSSTTVGAAPAPSVAPAGPRSLAGRNPAVVAVVGMALLAVALQVLRLTRPGAVLSGGSYDTTIYLGSAIRILHGALPYRDFALLQPPGLVLVLSPFALLSLAMGCRGALIVLSVCTPLLAGANVLLLGRLVAHRGWRAALTACALLAVYPAMYDALLDGLLEPLMCLFCLLGAVLIFDGDGFAGRRRIAAGGLCFGFATSILVAGSVPSLVMAAVCLHHPRRRLLPFGAGALAGFLAPVLPFFVLAPGSVVHDIVLTQLQRVPGTSRTPLATRLAAATVGLPQAPIAIALAAIAVLALVIVGGYLWTRSRLVPLEWFAVGAALTLGGAQLAIATYYMHFPAMVVPYPAILLGLAVARISPRVWPRLVPAVAVAALAAGTVALAVRFEGMSTVDYGPIVDAVIPVNGCSLSVHTQVLVQGDRFVSTVPGCTTMVDPYAAWLVFRDGPGGSLPVFTAALHHTDYLVTTPYLNPFLNGQKEPLRTYVNANFHPHRRDGLTIYVRDGFRVA